MSILVSFLRRLWSAGESSPPLRVLHRSPHFLVVEKPPDLVLNSDDPGRDSLHLRMAEQFKQLADFGKYKVRMGPPAWSQFTSSSFTSFSRLVHAAVLKFSYMRASSTALWCHNA